MGKATGGDVAELRECAQRIVKAVESPKRAEFDSETMWDLAFEDGLALADAYLADHPADDGKPVTGSWLTKMGFENILGSQCHFVRRDVPLVMIRIQGGMPKLLVGNSATGWDAVSEFPTRGDVRRLCRALGVGLNG